MSERVVTLYERSYCHLCEEMHAALVPCSERLGFRILRVDVDEHPEHEQRYGMLVPVLVEGGTEICHYHLDVAALERHFGAG